MKPPKMFCLDGPYNLADTEEKQSLGRTIAPPTRLERLLFAKLGDRYTPHHVRLLLLLETMSAGANELRTTLRPMIYYRLAAEAMSHLEQLGLASATPGMSEGGSYKKILIYSITGAGRQLLAKAREAKG